MVDTLLTLNRIVISATYSVDTLLTLNKMVIICETYFIYMDVSRK